MSDSLFDIVLAIDTSSPECKLALSFGSDRIVASRERVDRSHGQVLIKKIDELFQSAGVRKDDLQAVIACTGPGSFTGLRIGLAAAKGIAVALNIPVAGVSLFDVAACKLRHADRTVHVIIGLNRDECFLAPIREGSYSMDTVRVVHYDHLAGSADTASLICLGSETDAHIDQLALRNFEPSYLDYDASDVLHLGRLKLQTGRPDDLALLEPLYLQKSQAELRYERRHRQQ
ncbi:MAG TPA: tRNA (adenosine(37)-N6)-threonylcarbamoyltransferase complex dimerization subunit type 1 TsaB [Candidatus Deferrimicrobium sp.]|nr:tRNA (adenosine(37)-N6)-threonylcarbamoyltransferase complex dimerization subunit type 1 TsaB [Candidatus Deferrimicrobium sp.]